MNFEQISKMLDKLLSTRVNPNPTLRPMSESIEFGKLIVNDDYIMNEAFQPTRWFLDQFTIIAFFSSWR